jgi:nucleoid-associated protein YgaU
MVTMEARRPIAAMTMQHARLKDGQIRTDRARLQARTHATHASPVRLTRRGRIVVTALSALIIAVASVALATTAQATRAGGTVSPGKYVTKVAVQPGQSLWALAEAYDPDADTRLVIADIESMNSMTGDQLQPGETLWVPRG